MKNQQRIQKLKELIQKEIPKIMNLDFGCEVQYKHKRETETKTDIIIKIDWGADFKSYRTISGYIQSEKVITKIIGRPINLENVLRVIHKIGRTVVICKSCNGCIEDEMILEKWQLGQPLDNQTKETILFLCDVLGVEIK